MVAAGAPNSCSMVSRKVRVLTVNTVVLPARAIRCVVAVGCLVATKSIDLGGSPTSRKARREHKQNP